MKSGTHRYGFEFAVFMNSALTYVKGTHGVEFFSFVEGIYYKKFRTRHHLSG